MTTISAPSSPSVPPRGFELQEFKDRLSRAQRLLVNNGLDGLLLTTEPEFRYFTGFLSRFWLSPTRPWFLLVPASGQPVAMVPSIGADCVMATWLSDVRTWDSPQPEDEGVTLVANTLEERLGRTARVGMPQGPETHLRMPIADFQRLRALQPDMSYTDATDILKSLRMIKSPAEVEKIEHAASIVSAVFGAFPDHISAGQTEIDLFRLFKIHCLQNGIDDVDYLVGGAGPGGYTDIISPPTARPVQAGDVLMLDTGAVFDGYFCDFDRNFAFGHVAPETENAYESLLGASDAGFEAAQPGATCADLYHAMQGALRQDTATSSNVGRMGHGLGMQLTEWPSITATDMTVLEPGMVLTLEPSLPLDGNRVLVHEENLVVTETGARLLTRPAPRTIPIIQR